jgi:hypothetical protein
MNPRLVEPGFVVASAYTPTAPLVPRRTRTATTSSKKDDMGENKISGTWRRAQAARLQDDYPTQHCLR